MKPPIITHIEALLGQPLQLAPARGADTVSGVMPIRKKEPFRYALRNDRLAGLNLAGAQLDDAQWAQILQLLGSDAEHLEALNLRDNQLTVFPTDPAMRQLRYLDLCNNQLREFAPPPGVAEQLTHLWLYGNADLATPPPEIVAQGRYAIANYFREAKGEFVLLREAKLLLLGESGAGKTSFALKMKSLSNPLPKKDETTRGIAVETLPIGEGDKAFNIHLWDFGGQQIYHGTHRFFLTKRSLYVVLADNRKQDTDFDYWLQMAELYGEGSPLYVVVNQTDNRPAYPNLGGMKKRFDFLKDMLAANLDTLAEFDRSEGAAARNMTATQKVTDALKTRICELDHLAQPLPKAWYDIRKELERVRDREKRDFISLERYYDICAAHGIKDRERCLFLSAYLHDLGAVLHFQEDGALRETVILRMTWATDAVFKTYDSPLVHSGERPGYFRKADIRQIWSGDAYADKQEQLLALMLRFKLCYQIGESEEYIMPELLPFAQPDYAAQIPALSASELQYAPAVYYEYEFMPRGIFPRFAVLAHRHIAFGQQFIWREGVVLQSGDSYALVTETYGNRKIVVRSIGKRRRELKTIATEYLDSIHDTFPKLQVKKLVPCNCDTCRDLPEPHYFDYKSLLDRLDKGKETSECDKSFDHVPVRKLLDEIFADGRQMEPDFDRNEKNETKAPTAPKKVFLSYSHDRIKDAKDLKTACAVLEWNGKIEFWYDQNIEPGAKWEEEIKEKLEQADIIILLLSKEFWASNFIRNDELPLVEKRQTMGAKVLCVMLSHNQFKNTKWTKLQAVPQLKGRLTPISAWPDKDHAWNEVANALGSML
jgi:internalin A